MFPLSGRGWQHITESRADIENSYQVNYLFANNSFTMNQEYKYSGLTSYSIIKIVWKCIEISILKYNILYLTVAWDQWCGLSAANNREDIISHRGNGGGSGDKFCFFLIFHDILGHFKPSCQKVMFDDRAPLTQGYRAQVFDL